MISTAKPAVVLLSGGLDSSTVVATVNRLLAELAADDLLLTDEIAGVLRVHAETLRRAAISFGDQGRVPKWTKGTDCKSVISWVRIPPRPLRSFDRRGSAH